jgi:hypothetical protein
MEKADKEQARPETASRLPPRVIGCATGGESGGADIDDSDDLFDMSNRHKNIYTKYQSTLATEVESSSEESVIKPVITTIRTPSSDGSFDYESQSGRKNRMLFLILFVISDSIFLRC